MDRNHHLELFSYYVVDVKVKEEFIAIAPLLDKIYLDDTEHQSWIESTINYYDKILDDVVVFIDDDFTVNHKISNNMGIPLIRCGIHRFNLAVDQWTEDDF